MKETKFTGQCLSHGGPSPTFEVLMFSSRNFLMYTDSDGVVLWNTIAVLPVSNLSKFGLLISEYFMRKRMIVILILQQVQEIGDWSP